MSNPVVNIQVNIQTAPLPAALQKTGAFISQGGTNTMAGTLVSPDAGIGPDAAARSAGSAVGADFRRRRGSGNHPDPARLYDRRRPQSDARGQCAVRLQRHVPLPITGTSTFQYPLPNSPGSVTTLGTYVNAEANSLVQRATTFFNQGAGQSVYVLEPGRGTATEGVNNLSAWITANPGVYYSYLLPRFWDANAALLSFLPNFAGTGTKTVLLHHHHAGDLHALCWH